MKKEQAEKILDPETSRDALLEYEGEERIEAVNEACMVAASALRAQRAKMDRSRWEGCRFCIGFWNYGFCPECGRPLTEKAWAELERRILGNDEKADTH